MSNKLQHLVFGLVTIIGLVVYAHFSERNGGVGFAPAGSLGTGTDSQYIRETEYANGASGVVSQGSSLRHAYNQHKYDEAMELEQREDFAGAEKLFRDILARTPDEFLAAHGLGAVLFYQGRYEEAKRAYENELESAPWFDGAHLGIGAVARHNRRYEEASTQYTLAIRLNPNSALAYKGRGQSLFYLGRYTHAKADFEKVLALLPEGAPLATEAKEYLRKIEEGSQRTRDAR